MSCERIETLLHDHVDGLLEDEERCRVEAHLRDCDACSTEAEALERLKRRVAELPASVEPPRDLWPGIAARLRPRARVLEGRFAGPVGGSGGSGWRPSRAQWGAMAVAALLLMALSSGITAWWVGAGTSASVATSGGGLPGDATGIATEVATGTEEASGAAAGPLRAAQADHAGAIGELLWVLYEHRDDLDPATVTALETNLRVVDRAIRRAREALREDPADPGLARVLSRQYRRKLDLLQRANRIIERS